LRNQGLFFYIRIMDPEIEIIRGEKIELTLGQKRVGVKFNPSENEDVRHLKDTASMFIDQIEGLRTEGCTGEKHRLLSKAQTDIEVACMLAVKSVFTK
jgi:hypothetical protein